MARAHKVKGIDCDDTVVANARKIIDVRLSEMLGYGPYVDDPEHVEEIHNLRIAAKRLRYTLEMFQFAFPEELADLVSEVKEIQEGIGNMRDADLAIDRVLGIIEREAQLRGERVRSIALSSDRGSAAQRHQRIKSAVSAQTALRNEISLYTLVAYRAEERDRAYGQFLSAWQRMDQTDFPARLRRVVGLEDGDAQPSESGPASGR